MTAAGFRRIALILDGAEEVVHAGFPAFRVEGARSLRWPRKRLARKPDADRSSRRRSWRTRPRSSCRSPSGLEEWDIPIFAWPGASEDVLTGALRTEWKLRLEKNANRRQKSNFRR